MEYRNLNIHIGKSMVHIQKKSLINNEPGFTTNNCVVSISEAHSTYIQYLLFLNFHYKIFIFGEYLCAIFHPVSSMMSIRR